MLHPWKALNARHTPEHPQKETAEQLEQRLRSQYELALTHHRSDPHQTAHLLAQLSSELCLPKKRPRHPQPLWQRRLRHAVNRNLAHAYDALSQPLSATSAYSTALDDDPSDLLIWVRAARAAAQSGYLHVARRAYETALLMRPDHCLAKCPHDAVIRAIGDADEDKDSRVSPRVEVISNKMVRLQRDHLKRLLSSLPKAQPPEIVAVDELSWSCLVDALRSCLQRRLQLEEAVVEYDIGHPVSFRIPTIRTRSSAESSDDVEVVMESPTRRQNPADSVQVISDSSPCQSDPGTREKAPRCTPPDSLSADQIENGKEQGREDAAQRIPKACGSANTSGVKEALEKDAASPSSPLGTPQGTRAGELNTSKQDATGDTPISLPQEQYQERPVILPEAKRSSDMDLEVHNHVSNEIDSLEHGEQKKREVRRSARARMAIDGVSDGSDRRKTRTAPGMLDVTNSDAELIRTLLDLCRDESEAMGGSSSNSGDRGDASATDLHNSIDLRKADGNRRISLWTAVIDETAEAAKVRECVRSFEQANSGPADLLLRLLEVLSEIKVVQYFSTMALLWSTLRESLRLHIPGSAATSALIAEAMVASGKKTGKVKAQRFLEAGRLLSNIRLPSPMDENEWFLEIRLSWCWALLHECRGEMQLSFAKTENTLNLLRNRTFEPDMRIPESAGPDLAGYSCVALLDVISERLNRLKSARDLEKAEQELNRAGRGDSEAAKRTVAILGSSIRSAVRSLKLDQWDDGDLNTSFDDAAELERWEERLDAEVELEPRLRVFGDACAKSSDTVGELACFSVRLRMAVRYYAATLRSEIGKDTVQSKSRDSSDGRLADLLVQIRKYVAVVKKISASNNSMFWSCTVGITGWSMADASLIASITLICLTKLIITKIPVLKSATDTELGASQKNRRLGFTRCMLAFARCTHLMLKCRQSRNRDTESHIQKDAESELTTKMLFTTSFCLRALVVRGCCREEGTSGALMKMYVKFLSNRLQEIVTYQERAVTHLPEETSNPGHKESASFAAVPKNVISGACVDEENAEENPGRDSESSDTEEEVSITAVDSSYTWGNVKVIRKELAQCYQCIYQIPDIESGLSGPQVSSPARWLDEGCRVSKQIGLSFITGDPVPSSPTIDTDVCRGIYFFYRKRIFELFCQLRREGGRVKRLREVLSRLTEALPEDAPKSVPMLSFHALDTIVSEVVDSSEDISKQAAENVSRLEDEWIREQHKTKDQDLPSDERASNMQFSTLYFELFSLHAMSILSAHDSEYKRHKSAERRKHPKEAVDRVLTASSECLVALRSRPWSVGSWILLGRIFIEIADLALDERELNLSTFGISRSENMQSLGEGDSIETIFGRVEACFGFGESLLRHPWADRACRETHDISSARVLGSAFDGDAGGGWSGIGDDGDLFGVYGLTNSTTSRPQLFHELHPGRGHKRIDTRRLAAIRSGSAALTILRMREQRYFYVHWTLNALEPKLITHPRNRFPDVVVDLSVLALSQLREARHMYGQSHVHSGQADVVDRLTSSGVQASEPLKPIYTAPVSRNATPAWRQEHNGVERLKWFYSMIEAKLLRKVGKPPAEYLAVFHRALAENKEMRDSLKQPGDIEPFYKLHSARMKILRNSDDNAGSIEVLNLLEKYSFTRHSPPSVEDFPGKDIEDWIAERKTAIAEDILAAMNYCSSRKSEVSYSEFYFKSTYCKAVLLAEILKDSAAAREELAKCFRLEAAIKSLDQGHDAAHRGYFYKIWNYRFTDTGIEPAVETERKLVRWRGKLLGFYGQLLKHTSDWRSLAAIIYRLKKRNAEDLPVDGALLDDLVEAYAMTSRTALLSSMEKSIVTDVSAFEASYQRTWYIFEESLRLSQGVRRVRVGLNRGEKNETGAEILFRSGRPRCLVSMHTVLQLEHVRWKSALEGLPINLTEMRALPTEGKLRQIPRSTRMSYATTLQASVGKWQLEEKMMKLLVRRITELTAAEE